MFRAPEIINGVYHSKEVDVWSLGCYAHELATYQPPFNRYSLLDLLNAILNEPSPRIDENRWSLEF